MESPLGPIFTDIYMNDLESKLKHLLEKNEVVYWKRFIDDSFVLIKEDADVNKLLDILNKFDSAIRFTCEEEQNNSIPFPDVLITRTTNNPNTGAISNISKLNSFSTSIYRKPTFTGLLLKRNSFVRHSYKVSAINSMIYRASHICSSYSSMHTEFEYIQNLALENGYPLSFVQNQARKTLNRHLEGSRTQKEKLTRSRETENTDTKKEQILIHLPFIGNKTKTLGKKDY